MPERPARTLMIQGTASGAGKSLITAALCRSYARRGVRVLPFKAQNMSNNAAVTAAGGEIGRAQALQARAAGVEPDVRMNPVLLKPLADTRSDVVVLGASDPALTALPWHERRARLWPIVAGALDALRAEAELVIIEGAGSPAETNLRRSDIVNMAVARHAGSPVVLVADIDRGGAFAALYGTWALLEPGDRRLVRGFVLNRFRGDAALLAPAPADLERRTGVPTLGVVPYTRHQLPQEDAMGMVAFAGTGPVTIAAVRLPHVANFDDLDPLAAEPGVRVHWVDRPAALQDAAAILIPGTRNTIADLRWLWESGLAAAIRARHAAGTPVIGLCGGYQMLGTRVADPGAVEAGGACQGLGLLDVETELAAGKTTRLARAVVAEAAPFAALHGATVEGYEIHHGRTRIGAGAMAWLHAGGDPIGACHVEGPAAGAGAPPSATTAAAAAPPAAAWGAYLHGLFHDDALRAAFLRSLRAEAGGLAWQAHVDRELDRVADVVERGLDMAALDALVRESRA